jgi:hypothetical protein
MTDRNRSPQTGDHSGMAYDDGARSGIPRWAKVLGIIVIVVALLVIAMMLVGGGRHSPGGHSSPGDGGGRRLP